MARRRGRRYKKLLDDLKDRRGYSHLEEEVLIALCGGIVLEEALDLSSDRILVHAGDKFVEYYYGAELIFFFDLFLFDYLLY